MMDIEAEEYCPDNIRLVLDRWREWESGAEGATGQVLGGGGHGRHRLDIAMYLADLERAADALPLEWASTLRVFRAQGRQQVWADRRKGCKLPIRLDEYYTVEDCIWRMARFLGWSE
jgi:hypothetical protein